jgi:hypothetical protein
MNKFIIKLLMGSECSSTVNSNSCGNPNTSLPNIETTIENSKKDERSQKFTFEVKNYRDYSNKLEFFKLELREILKRVEIANEFEMTIR